MSDRRQAGTELDEQALTGFAVFQGVEDFVDLPFRVHVAVDPCLDLATTFPLWKCTIDRRYGYSYVAPVRVIAKGTLKYWCAEHPPAAGALLAWLDIIEGRAFRHFPDLKAAFGSADQIRDDRVVFNIKGNHYRLLARLDYQRQLAFTIWFGTHKEYDNIKPAEVAYVPPSHKD